MIDPGRPRVFGIGLNKTGTTTLDKALTILGYVCLHHGRGPVRDAVKAALHSGQRALDRLDSRFDAFCDVGPLTRNFRVLDRQYPGSRFILTFRELDDWLDSRRQHVLRNQRNEALGRYDGGFVTIDVEAWTEEYLRHHATVRRYFRDRPDDLLEIDITAGAGWDPLCRFLGCDIPDAPFPWQNRARPLAELNRRRSHQVARG